MKHFRKLAVLTFVLMAIASTIVQCAQTPAAKSPLDSSKELGKRALALLAEAMKSESAGVRLTAVQTWGTIGNPAAVPLLKKALKDDDVYVRIAAAQSLYSLHSGAGIPVLKSIIREKTAPSDAENPVEELMSMARDKSRVRAVEVLSGIKDKSVQEALEAALNDNAGGVRDAAAIGLARMGNSDYVQQFFDALKDKDETIRSAAVSALGAIASPEALDALSKMAADPSARVRQALMRALESLSDPAAVDLTVAALKDTDADVRSLALGDLSKINDAGTIALLIKILKDAQSSDAQLKASAGLARRGQTVDLTLAAMTLNQRDADLKNLALDVLRADDSQASTDILAKLMRQDPEPQTRITAAAILVKRLQRAPEPRQ